jgi:hypothetical protein
MSQPEQNQNKVKEKSMGQKLREEARKTQKASGDKKLDKLVKFVSDRMWAAVGDPKIKNVRFELKELEITTEDIGSMEGRGIWTKFLEWCEKEELFVKQSSRCECSWGEACNCPVNSILVSWDSKSK